MLQVSHSVVLVVEHVKQVESHATHVVPPFGVYPVSHDATHVLFCKYGNPV